MTGSGEDSESTSARIKNPLESFPLSIRCVDDSIAIFESASAVMGMRFSGGCTKVSKQLGNYTDVQPQLIDDGIKLDSVSWIPRGLV